MYIYGDQNVKLPKHLNFGKYMLDHLRAVKSDNICLVRIQFLHYYSLKRAVMIVD